MLYELVKVIRKDAHVEVLFMQDGRLKDAIEELGVKTHLIKSPKMRHGFNVLIWMIKYFVFLKQIKPTLVLSWMPKAHLFTSIPSFIANLPSYWWQHGVPDPPNFFDKITSILPAKKVGSSSTIAKLAQQNLTKKPVFCTFPGVDIIKHSPNERNRNRIRKELGIDEDTILIGNVGRIQRWKRQDLLIKSLNLLIKKHSNAKVLLVGGNLYNLDNEYEKEVLSLIKELGLEDKIITTGNQLDVSPYFDAMDIYVHTANGEPFGIVMVEAMLHAKPLIAVKSPGSLEIIKDGVTGFIVDEGSPELLNIAMDKMILEREDFPSIGEQGRTRAIKFFSNKQMGDSILRELVPKQYNKNTNKGIV
ncbi:glycosyltransferase [Metabacillus litoralis]|uniref:glycosyltransferase n=1 Tax=Metabacillus litoralis TaxID=152268 RepID=UPI00203CF807|nr:glycosyltransferase [Metabacillus litoralis]MCM3161739.1 glycosyltransferase [Metabacillus litoralis]